MRRVAVATAVVLAAAGVCGRATAARFVVDRNLVCNVGKDGSGARVVRVVGRAATERFGLEYSRLSVGQATAFIYEKRRGWVEVEPRRGVFINRKVCRRTRIVVPLSRRGLPGPATALPTTATCPAQSRIFVHVRATLIGEAGSTRGRVVSASIAVRSERPRKLLSLVSLTRGAKALQLFAARGCDVQTA